VHEDGPGHERPARGVRCGNQLGVFEQHRFSGAGESESGGRRSLFIDGRGLRIGDWLTCLGVGGRSTGRHSFSIKGRRCLLIGLGGHTLFAGLAECGEARVGVGSPPARVGGNRGHNLTLGAFGVSLSKAK
jgi:hypothetical protein